jgi:hypothetical protein
MNSAPVMPVTTRIWHMNRLVKVHVQDVLSASKGQNYPLIERSKLPLLHFFNHSFFEVAFHLGYNKASFDGTTEKRFTFFLFSWGALPQVSSTIY